MVGKGRVVTTAMLCMYHQTFIQYSGLKICICPVITQHPQDVFRGRQILARITDDQRSLIIVMLIGMIIVHSDQRHDSDQKKALPEYIGDRSIIRSFVVRVQGQNRALHTIHDIRTRCLQDNIPDKLGGKLTILRQKMYKFAKLTLIGKFSKQKQIGRFLEVEFPILVSLDKFADLISLKIKFAFDRDRFTVDLLAPVDIGDLCQSGEHASSV